MPVVIKYDQLVKINCYGVVVLLMLKYAYWILLIYETINWDQNFPSN